MTGGESPATDGGALAGGPLARVSDGVSSLEEDGTVASINGAGAELLGSEPSELIGERPWDIYPEAEDSPLRRAYRETRVSGERATVTEYHGSLEEWFEVHAYPGEDGLTLLFRTADRSETRVADGTAMHRLHETVSDTDLTVGEKLTRLLAIGRDRLGTGTALVGHIDGATWEAVEWVGAEPPATTMPAERSYCQKVVGQAEPLAVTDAEAEGWGDDSAYETWGLACYLGATVEVGGESHVVCFADTEPRERAFSDEETAFVELLADWVRYVLELEHEQAFIDGVLDSLPDPLYAFDGDGELVRWNDRLRDVTGYDDDDLAGRQALSFVAPADRERVASELARVEAGERVSFETDLQTKQGDRLPYEMSGAPITEDGEVVGATGVARDVSEQHARREMLSGLLEATGSLMQARDREEVAEIVANRAKDVLGFDINVVRLYDAAAGVLRPAALSKEMAEKMGDRPVYEVGEGIPGEVFATGEPRTVDHVTDDQISDHGDVRSVMYHPLGVHGTISVGATEPAAFDATDRQVLALLATSAAAAFTRAKREREVREAREHTETVLNRVNGLIEDTVEVLVQATTREELEEGVVSELAAAEPYTFAWIGRPDVASETLSPGRWAGSGDVPAAELSFDLNGDDPVATAYRSGQSQVIQDLPDRAGDLDYADRVLGGGVRASIVVPLAYKQTTYGVLAVFADEVGAFDEREQVVIDALGRAVGNAINAVERGRIMDATEIIELEFTVNDSDLLFCRLSRGADCRVAAAETDLRADGSVRLYLTAEGVDGERLVRLAREDGDVTEARLITDHEGDCLLELTVVDSVLATLSEFGAATREVVGEAGQARFTLELPYEAEAREVFELVERRYPSTDLVGYHERERPVETRQEFRASLSERFTDRQETALRTAYLGGFFEWPRDIDGNELAEAMDISRPTYHQHLRAAQRKVLEELFD